MFYHFTFSCSLLPHLFFLSLVTLSLRFFTLTSFMRVPSRSSFSVIQPFAVLPSLFPLRYSFFVLSSSLFIFPVFDSLLAFPPLLFFGLPSTPLFLLRSLFVNSLPQFLFTLPSLIPVLRLFFTLPSSFFSFLSSFALPSSLRPPSGEEKVRRETRRSPIKLRGKTELSQGRGNCSANGSPATRNGRGACGRRGRRGDDGDPRDEVRAGKRKRVWGWPVLGVFLFSSFANFGMVVAEETGGERRIRARST